MDSYTGNIPGLADRFSQDALLQQFATGLLQQVFSRFYSSLPWFFLLSEANYITIKQDFVLLWESETLL